jgi:hypothetical protein
VVEEIEPEGDVKVAVTGRAILTLKLMPELQGP